jgi:hypothetical protein
VENLDIYRRVWLTQAPRGVATRQEPAFVRVIGFIVVADVGERGGAESAISEGQRGLRRHVRERANEGMIEGGSGQKAEVGEQRDIGAEDRCYEEGEAA